ncbi:MAG TPA: hypothetical protein VF553_01395 [Pyrinomonadaceae bacterium]|jgi:ABC-type nickel/cobalt efflux system permease component RcnA
MNDPLLLALGLGFLLGLKHATEADHLVAITTIVSEQRSIGRAAAVGALWGVGHTAALFLAAVLVILLRVAIPLRLAALLEFLVALMIILLGTRILYLVLRRQHKVHVHAHEHDGHAHTHLHFHTETDAHGVAESSSHDNVPHRSLWGWKPLLVGMMHGLAGSAALTLLVLAEVVRGGSRALGVAYMVIFGIGSIGGMLLMSILISLPFVSTARRFQWIHTPVRLVAGIMSVAFGLYYAWRTTGGL